MGPIDKITYSLYPKEQFLGGNPLGFPKTSVAAPKTSGTPKVSGWNPKEKVSCSANMGMRVNDDKKWVNEPYPTYIPSQLGFKGGTAGKDLRLLG